MGGIPRIGESSSAVENGAHAVTAEILASIESLGYAHIKLPLSEEGFETIAESLGSIALRTDLTITPNRSSIVYKPDEIGFHQDNPTMSMIGWYCVQQDELDGSGRLLDAGDVAGHFSPEERKVLGTISVRCPDSDPKRHNPDIGVFAYFLWPLLVEKARRCHVYYAPWLLLDSYDEEQSRALEKFAEYLRAKEENQAISIRLKKGESLFIDNNRMLHGRGPIQPDSKRFLKRVWIKRDA